MPIQQGMNQQTPAVQNTLRGISKSLNKALGPVRKKRKRKAKKAKSTGSKKRKKRSTPSAKQLVKGSAAAKNYMAKIRKLRGKK